MLGAGSTVYDVRLDYSFRDKGAKKGVEDLARGADRANSSFSGLKGVMAAVAGGTAFHLGKKYLIDYNSQIDSMKISLSTVIGSQLHVPFAKASKEADRLFDVFQEMAKKSPATTKDYIEMANGIARGVTMAGMGTKDLQELTGGAVIAAQAFGIRADMAALDIEQMLAGNVTNRDRMAKALLGSMGLSHTEFNKLNQSKRNDIVKKSLGQQSIKDAAEAFGNSFEGQISTLQDNLQITFGKVGLPLMQAITAEIKKWNTWIDKNPAKIKEFVQDFGNAMKEGFTFGKELVSMLIENKDTLMNIAKVWLAIKGTGMAIGAGKGLFDNMKTGLAGASSGLGGMVAGLGSVVGALAALYLAAKTFATWVDHQQGKDIDADTDASLLAQTSGRFVSARIRKAKNDKFGWGMTPKQTDELNSASMGLLRNAYDMGALKKTSLKGIPGIPGMPLGLDQLFPETGLVRLDVRKLEEGLSKTALVDSMQAQVKAYTMEADKLMTGNSALANMVLGMFPAMTAEQKDGLNSNAKTKVDVNINRIEVTSDDPDRFVYDAINAFEEVARNPTQASVHKLRSFHG